jgi:protein ImuB
MPVRKRAPCCARLLRTVHNVSVPNPGPRVATPLYACLYQPPAPDVGPDVGIDVPRALLEPIAREFSPRYERHHDHLVSIDVSGLERMLGNRTNHTGVTTGLNLPPSLKPGASTARRVWRGGGAGVELRRATGALREGGRVLCGCLDPARMIGEELRREAVSRGVRVHVAVAATRMAALVLAHARPGVTIAAPGDQVAALAAIPIGILQHVMDIDGIGAGLARPDQATFKRWGVKTLGELAALPPADLTSRFGRHALIWQAIARGEDVRPLVPTLEDERFEASLDLEWPIDGLEPLSFVLTRLLEPLSTRLERRDRGTAVLHVILRLVTREPYARRLELPSPMRDVRTLRTLALLDLESHPPGGAIDRVTIVIDPTPGRILQHTLFTRAHPTPEQLSTLLARLAALMGQDRLGAPAMVDSYRPDAFAMVPFPTEHDDRRGTRRAPDHHNSASSADSALNVVTAGGSALNVVVSAVRRCRQPVPARVAVQDGTPVRVTTDRRGFVGGTVVTCVGPWRSSGNWWDAGERLRPHRGPQRGSRAGVAHRAEDMGILGSVSASVRAGGGAPAPVQERQAGSAGGEHPRVASNWSIPPIQSVPPIPPILPVLPSWDCDEWDVALTDGAVYRIFQDRATGGWFIDAIVD